MNGLIALITLIWLILSAIYFIKMHFVAKEQLPGWCKKLAENRLPNREDQQIHITLLKPVNAYMRSDYLSSFVTVIKANIGNPRIYKILNKGELRVLLLFNRLFWISLIFLGLAGILMAIKHFF